MRKLSILGSTGSIGTQALRVVEHLGKTDLPMSEQYTVTALTANTNIALLEQQIRRFRPDFAAVFDKEAAGTLQKNVRDLPVKIGAGMEGLLQAAALNGCDTVLNAVVGMVGLQPTLEAIAAKKTVALANKETLVAGGSLVMAAAKQAGVQILPVDSEHSAVFQCLQGCKEKKHIKRLLLTASGGPFFGKSREQLQQVTLTQALHHPSWNMGAKITIDSATMMNKGFEIIEAAWLFDMPPEKIDVLVHPESIVHSMVEFADNSVLAQLGVPDMCIPIEYALVYPRRVASPVQQLDLAKQATLHFYSPDDEAFPAMQICRRAFARGGLVPAAANGANEAAVALFLQEKISFAQIAPLVSGAADAQDAAQPVTVQSILQADAAARAYVHAGAVRA